MFKLDFTNDWWHYTIEHRDGHIWLIRRNRGQYSTAPLHLFDNLTLGM